MYSLHPAAWCERFELDEHWGPQVLPADPCELRPTPGRRVHTRPIETVDLDDTPLRPADVCGSLSSFWPAVSDRGRALLEATCGGDLRFVGLDCPTRPLWLVDPLREVPVDEARSTFWPYGFGEALLAAPSFRSKDVVGATIFRSGRTRLQRPFITEATVAALLDAGLTGLDAVPAWSAQTGAVPAGQGAEVTWSIGGPWTLPADERQAPPVETVPTPDEEAERDALATQMRLLLALDAHVSPDMVVRRIHQETEGRSAENEHDEEWVLGLAFLFGDQVVRQLGWQWRDVDYGEGPVTVVVSADRAYVVDPIAVVGRCLDEDEAAALMVFTWITEAGLDAAARPGAYRSIG